MFLVYQKPHNLQRLNDELIAKVQFIKPISVMQPDGQTNLVARHILCGDGQTVYLNVPDNLTPEQIAEIEQVVNNHYPNLTVSASPNPAVANETVAVTASLPTGAPDTEVTFQLEGGTAYTEPVVNGKASHNYAFTMPGTYRINISSARCGIATVEVVVQ